MPEWSFPRLVRTRTSAIVVSGLLTLLLNACSGSDPSPSKMPAEPSDGAVSSPTTSAGPIGSSGPTVGAIDHKTGATDVILRIEQGGGFVRPEFQVTNAPGFTLFGNGVVVFQPTATTFPQPDANGVARGVPWRTGLLDETQIQGLLEFALTNGGLGTARVAYLADGIADAPNTIFTIHAGGIDKTVVVNALAEESRTGLDALARSAFFQLAKRLQDFDQGGTIPSDVYVADRYRGVLIARDAQAGIVTTAWPWAALTPADFKEGPNDGTGPAFPHRTLSAPEIAELKLEHIEGGVQGMTLKAPDGKLYSFILRPLLADEKE